MLFTKWEGTLYHEKLKDFIPGEYFAMEISPLKIENHKKLRKGKGTNHVPISALIEEEIADLELASPVKRKTVLFSATGSFDPQTKELDLRYLDKTTLLKASFSADGKVIEGRYISYKINHTAGSPLTTDQTADTSVEVEMKFKLLPCWEVEK